MIKNPILFVLPGLTSDSQTGYIKNLVNAANSKNYDVVVINFRGLGGAELATPKLHHYGAWEDALEPMTYIFNKYCKNQNRKAFAVGLSMGGNILA